MTNSPISFSRHASAHKELKADQPLANSAEFIVNQNVSQYSIGTKGDVSDMLKKVTDGKRSEIIVPPADEQGNLKAKVTSTWIKSGKKKIDFDGDGFGDQLLLRTVEIPGEDGKDRKFSWLVAAVDSDHDGNISDVEEKAARVLTTGIITYINLADLNKDHKTDIIFTSNHITTRALADKGKEDDILPSNESAALLETALAYLETLTQAEETSVAKFFMHKGFAPEMDKVSSTKTSAFYEVLRPLAYDIELAAKKLEAKDGLSVAEKIVAQSLKNALIFTSEEAWIRDEMIKAVGKKFSEIDKSLEWKGYTFIDRNEFDGKLRSTADPAERKAMAEYFQKRFGELYAKDGPYHQFIEKMNEFAVRHGYKNYAEIRILEKFGITVEQLKEMATMEMAKLDVQSKAYIEKLEKFSGHSSINYWDMPFIERQYILKRTGGKKFPDIDPKYAMTIPERFLNDLGFNLKDYNIIADPFADPLKGPAVASATVTRDLTYFTSQMDKTKPIDTKLWKSFFHEPFHGIQNFVIGESGFNFSVCKNSKSQVMKESLAYAMQDAMYVNPKLMKRYLGELPGFTDELIEAYTEIERDSRPWITNKGYVQALMEISLYENCDNWEEAISKGAEMIRSHLFVNPENLPYGSQIFYTHSFKPQEHLTYASNVLEVVNMRELRDKYLTDVTPENLKALGNAIIQYIRNNWMPSVSTQ